MYLKNEILIKDIKELSYRSSHTLIQNGYEYFSQIAVLDDVELLKIKNLGKKSVAEIIGVIQKYEKTFNVDSMPENSKKKELKSFLGTGGNLYYDNHIECLDLSNRSQRVLLENNFTHISQLVMLNDNDYKKMKSLGNKSIAEITEKIQKYQEKNKIDVSEKNNSKYVSSPEYIASVLIQQFFLPLGFSVQETLKELVPLIKIFIANFYNVQPLVDIEVLLHNRYFFNHIFESAFMNENLESSVLNVFKHNIAEIDMQGIKNNFPEFLQKLDFIDKYVLKLIYEKKLERTKNNKIRITLPSIVDLIATLEESRNKDIFVERLHGKTLEEIGKTYSLSRERVRQIFNRILQKIDLPVKEDYYKPVFEKYSFSCEDFLQIFSEQKETYWYLFAVCSRGEKKIEEILSDESITEIEKKQVEKIVYKNYITDDDKRIKKTRKDLITHVLKSYCQNDIEYSDFFNIYLDFLNTFGLEKNEELVIDVRYKNRIADDYPVLWKWGQKFRYYNVNDFDFSDFFQTLAFEQYTDVEFSTLKFFRDYPDLMKSYNILDEYELHNLLRKLLEKEKNTNITFGRMPTIIFGTANKNNQVFDLLLQLAPISLDDFVNSYEKEYGVLAQTVKANYLTEIFCYLHNGVFELDLPEISMNEYNIMKDKLTNDFYMIQTVKDVYKANFPNSDIGKINSLTISKLGFKIFSAYVLKNYYSSVTDFFTAILTQKDIVDTQSFGMQMCALSTYHSVLAKLKNEYEIIEFSRNKYINIRKLESFGIQKNDITDYCQKVYHFVAPNSYFTIKSMRNDGFSHLLDDLGFEDFFYSSILAQNTLLFSCIHRLDKTKILKNGIGAQLAGLIEQEALKVESIDIYDLISFLKKRFDIDLQKSKIIDIIQSTDLHYDYIMEKVYINYSTYFEEI